jgi:hypothetical protein
MGIETPTPVYIDGLNAAQPSPTDPLSQADDHLRNIKGVLKRTFSEVTGEVTATQEELNKLDGCTTSTSELNILTGCTASSAELNKLVGLTADASELNKLDGCTASVGELNVLTGSGMSAATMANLAGLSEDEIDTLQDINTASLSSTELNHVSGVTSSIQGQLDTKQDTLTAGQNVSISSNTISATGCPSVVVGDVDSSTSSTAINTSWVYIPVNTLVLNQIGASTNNASVYLPAGTYYFEADCHIRNSSYSNGIGSVRCQLVTTANSQRGYEHNSRVGESGEITLQPSGTFTITQTTSFSLKVIASESGRAKYNDSASSASRLASRIKFWKVS